MSTHLLSTCQHARPWVTLKTLMFGKLSTMARYFELKQTTGIHTRNMLATLLETAAKSTACCCGDC
jgi:hypothetical protein